MIQKTTFSIVFIFLVVSTLPARAADETTQQAAEWKVGVASAKITPEQRLHMAGYAARKEPAEGTHQDLFGKAIGSRCILPTSIPTWYCHFALQVT